MYCKILTIFLTLFIGANVSFAALDNMQVVAPIGAEKSAYVHNKKGTEYFQEGDYMAALKEFKIAIGINPNTQATAVYYNNLGKVYMHFGAIQKLYKTPKGDADFAQMAQVCFERSIIQDCMKFEYYTNLVESYELQGVASSKLVELKGQMDKKPFNVVPVAIILKKQGKTTAAYAILNNFIVKNPDLVIAGDIKKFMKTLK